MELKDAAVVPVVGVEEGVVVEDEEAETTDV